MPSLRTCKGSATLRPREAEVLPGIITAVLLVLFIVGWLWAWSPRRKQDFEAAAQLPLDDQEPYAPVSALQRNKERAS